MKILKSVKLSPEQLELVKEKPSGVLVIRGSAGSGKTTTALMRLRQLSRSRLARRTRLEHEDPVRVLVLTYNKTLKGYVEALAAEQVTADPNLTLTVATFAKWAKSLVGSSVNVDADRAEQLLRRLARDFSNNPDFICDEVKYLLGRFAPHDLESYLTTRRQGRGASPRMEEAARRRLLDEVVYPYLKQKADRKIGDWRDLETAAAAAQPDRIWDVVVVDETQDFTANMVRAVLAHTDDDTSTTFIIDAVQQIYKHGFAWSDVGLKNPRVRSLKKNHRNTRQIAAFARPLVDGLTVGSDGMLPDLDAATREGPKPVVLSGRFLGQLQWVLDNIVRTADLANESVAFLHALGGGWNSELLARLDAEKVPYVDLQRADHWPAGDEAVAVSTLHSAKGLEFDHVVILGLNAEVTPHGADADDTDLDGLRRLLAMGIGRAQQTVTIGYKPTEASTLVSYFAADTYTKISV
jgi:superfamily I DNA/RNA helicase